MDVIYIQAELARLKGEVMTNLLNPRATGYTGGTGRSEAEFFANAFAATFEGVNDQLEVRRVAASVSQLTAELQNYDIIKVDARPKHVKRPPLTEESEALYRKIRACRPGTIGAADSHTENHDPFGAHDVRIVCNHLNIVAAHINAYVI